MMDQQIFVKSLPYIEDSTKLFDRIVRLPGAVFLDSGRPHGNNGRFDILAALPHTLVSSKDGITQVKKNYDIQVYEKENPFDILRQQLQLQKSCRPYPFLTGGIGYFSYDLGRQIESLPQIAKDEECLPEMAIGIYDWGVIVDHAVRQTTLVGVRDAQLGDHSFDDLYTMLADDNFDHDGTHDFIVKGNVESNIKKEEYFEKFARVMDYIKAGDCYQVNLAQKFFVSVEGNPWHAYKHLRSLNSSPYSAYLDYDKFQILSISPERFLRVQANQVETKPIKGTRSRHQDHKLDRQAEEALRVSDKDKAENLMIVDLLRNDLSKNCRLNSVRVKKLFDIETFANVYHLVSTIEGRLENNKDALDLLQGCFPGGSITGAPKLRAMQIIEELEPHRRGVYCGAIGYISRHGNMDLNIAIRTIVCHEGEMSFYAGGGLVADSNVEAEYQETLDKVSTIFQLLSESQKLSHISDIGTDFMPDSLH